GKKSARRRLNHKRERVRNLQRRARNHYCGEGEDARSAGSGLALCTASTTRELSEGQSDQRFGLRSQRWDWRFSRRAESIGPASLTAMFSRTCSGFLIPTMVVLTTGFARMKRRAMSGRVILEAVSSFSASTRGNVAFRFSGPKYRARQSVFGKRV